MDTAVRLIVGLGNPGPKYEGTRHNAGADFVYAITQQLGAALKDDKKFFGLTAKVVIDSRELRLLIPTTYMNRSGQGVAALANFYGIGPGEILVAHDDLDLPPGTARLKIGGGHGGHNGLRDIIATLGNCRDFARLRLGIGHPGHSADVVDYVLRKAPPKERGLIEESIQRASELLFELTAGQWNAAMKKLHTS